MAINGLIKWEAGGISDALTNGFVEAEVHKSTTGIGGVYTKIVGSETTLVVLQEDYTYTDVTAELTHTYKVRHHGAGKYSGFSAEFGFISTADVDITETYLKAAYYDAEDQLQATWKTMKLHELMLNKVNFSADGNRPYVIGTDYVVVVCLAYVPESTEIEEGRNLAGATINVVFSDHLGNVVKTKTNGQGITLRSQGTLQSLDGTMGEFEISFADDETDDDGDEYERKMLRMDGEVVWPGGAKTLEFRGQFEMLRGKAA